MIFKNNIFLIAALLVLVSCTKEATDYTLKGYVFGTTYKIVYLKGQKNYQKSIDSLFFLMNKSLSTYLPGSDISKINKGDSTVIVDDMFLEVFKKSKRIHKETNGFFDPTVGNLVNAWGFGPKREKVNLSKEQVKEEMQYVGLDKVAIVDGKVKKQDSKIYLDFNSIAK
jgi:thiamine biosynthesis lipoprotein